MQNITVLNSNEIENISGGIVLAPAVGVLIDIAYGAVIFSVVGLLRTRFARLPRGGAIGELLGFAGSVVAFWAVGEISKLGEKSPEVKSEKEKVAE